MLSCTYVHVVCISACVYVSVRVCVCAYACACVCVCGQVLLIAISQCFIVVTVGSCLHSNNWLKLT